MPNTSGNGISDVRNWPSLLLSFVLACLCGLIVYQAGALINKVDKLADVVNSAVLDFKVNAATQKFIIEQLEAQKQLQNNHTQKLNDLERKVDKLETILSNRR